MNILDRLDVSTEVKEHVTDYLLQNSLGDMAYVGRKSNHPDDHYLYEVVAKQNDGTYSVWTSWNESTLSLNHGHYGIKDFDSAMEVVMEFYNDVLEK